MSLDAIQKRQRRLYILHTLTAAVAFEANDELLFLALNDSGHNCNRGQLRRDFRFLESQELIKTEQTLDLSVITLTAKGEDVAQGRLLIEGIQRPRPGRS